MLSLHSSHMAACVPVAVHDCRGAVRKEYISGEETMNGIAFFSPTRFVQEQLKRCIVMLDPETYLVQGEWVIDC